MKGARSWVDQQVGRDPAFRAELAGERLVVALSVAIEQAMQARGLNRAGLARALGASEAYVTKLLRGDGNLKLKTVAKVADALGYRVKLALEPRETGVRVVAAGARWRRVR